MFILKNLKKIITRAAAVLMKYKDSLLLLVLHPLLCSTAQNMNCPISTTALTLHCKTTAHNSTTTVLQNSQYSKGTTQLIQSVLHGTTISSINIQVDSLYSLEEFIQVQGSKSSTAATDNKQILHQFSDHVSACSAQFLHSVLVLALSSGTSSVVLSQYWTYIHCRSKNVQYSPVVLV